MKVSELLSVLQKVQQVSGDIPVVVRDIEHDVETVLRTVGIRIDPTGTDGVGRVELEHGWPPAASDPTPTEPAAAESAS